MRQTQRRSELSAARRAVASASKNYARAELLRALICTRAAAQNPRAVHHGAMVAPRNLLDNPGAARGADKSGVLVMANATVANQAKILANQAKIMKNQGQLAKIVANQKTIIANQNKILANQKLILAK
ncbi:MAG: hypothetical protein ACT4PU_06355 [Planctomycetota bacterium]